MIIMLSCCKIDSAVEEGGSEPKKTGEACAGARCSCRPCCTAPHGFNSIVVAVIASLALAFSFVALTSCEFFEADFLYCQDEPEPAPLYAFCGDCHCINGDDPCPTGDDVPPTEVSNEYLRELRSVTLTNQMNMTCNPYNTTDRSCTSPPQDEDQLDLWETAMCGVKYDLDTLDEDSCPTQYSLQTYNNEEEMVTDGAFLTHFGACGVCSSLQDLSTYLQYPDLTAKGTECSLRAIAKHADGITCYTDVGYTPPCAEMWVYNGYNTRDQCLGTCVDFTLAEKASNGPPPECRIADCLLCDEQMSGPIFQTVAARSRRRSGLLSKIARSCSIILIVPQISPCQATNATAARLRGRGLSRMEISATQHGLLRSEGFDGSQLHRAQSGPGKPSSVRPVAPKTWQAPQYNELPTVEYDGEMSYGSRHLQSAGKPNPNRPVAPEQYKSPRYNETCFYIKNNLGLRRYQDSESGGSIFDFNLFPTEQDEFEKTFYDVCFAYKFKDAKEGYWANVNSRYLGTAHGVAEAFAIIAVILGCIPAILMWSSLCVAYQERFWKSMAIILACAGVCSFITLSFFASDVCEFGCTWKEGATFAVLAGVFFLLTAVLTLTMLGPAKKGRAIKCGCCGNDDEFLYQGVPTGISVTETLQEDGTTIVETVTDNPDGTKTVEVMTKRVVESSSKEGGEVEPSGKEEDYVEPSSKPEDLTEMDG